MKPGSIWVLLCCLLASGVSLERHQIVPVLDGNVALADLQGTSRQLNGSNFELESDANIKVDSPGKLDFANAPATQFFPPSGSSLVVTGFYRELVPTNNGVYFYIYWISQQARQPITVEFRQSKLVHTPLDVRIFFNPDLGLVNMDLWSCFPVGSLNCTYAAPSGTSWNMDQSIAYFSYNSQIIPGSETNLVTDPAAPSGFLTQQAAWKKNGIPIGYYGKGGLDLRKLPCYAALECADYSFIGISPAGSNVPIDIIPFENGYCSHINILKTNSAGSKNLSGAVFGLYTALGVITQMQKAKQVGNCTTDTSGKCTIPAPIGTYLLFELKAPPGFIPISPRIVTITQNGMMLSYPLKDKSGDSTGLKIQKVSETGALVAGASFIIRQRLDNGTVIQFEITNSPSTFCTDYLQNFPVQFLWDDNLCVTVDVIETTPPIGFLPINMPNTTWCAVPDEDKQNCTARGVLRVVDQSTPTITLTKVGSPDVPIIGTVLGLSTSGDPNQNYSAIPSYARCTIAKGQSSCKIKAPTLGSYYAVEILPPSLYMRAPPQGPLNIVAGGSYAITITDVLQAYGAPTIQRLDCYGSAVSMTGASYSVTSGSITVIFNGANGFFRTCFANGTNLFPMDQNGCADFIITELAPPNNQVPALNQTLNIHYCGNSQSLPDCGERPIDGAFESPVCTGSVVVRKTGDSSTGSGSIPLDGVVFSLTNPDTGFSSQQTSQDGGSICWTDVPIGSYILKEVSTLPGYAIDTGSRRISVSPTDSLNSCDNPSNEIEIYNYRCSGSFKIAKKKDVTYAGYAGDGTSDYLSGAKFLVKRTGSTWSTTITIGASGVECVQVDSLGTFTVEEISPPPGYSISSPSIQSITLTSSLTCSQTSYLLTFTDRPVTSAPSPTPSTTCPPSTNVPSSTYAGGGGGSGYCAVQIKVYGQRSYPDAPQEPLAGATLEIRDTNGNLKTISMTSETACVSVPSGGYQINQISPPHSTEWTPVTTFPVNGECTTPSVCPQFGASNNIYYTAP